MEFFEHDYHPIVLQKVSWDHTKAQEIDDC